MGVTGLHSYICETGLKPAIQEKINLLEEIKMWKISHIRKNNKRPKIIIDLKEIVHAAVQNDYLGLILGGRYRNHLYDFRKFFQALKKANVDLIFFAIGRNLRHEPSVFIPNQSEEYERYLNVMDKLDAMPYSVSSLCDRKALDARAPITMYYNMHKLARELGEFRINYVCHNREIAKYIAEHDDTVLAVITNDNDFMIFDGHFQFWQANDINLRGLTGIRKSREKLRTRLELNSKQLQLLSALSGSMYLPKDRLTTFYQKISYKSVGRHYIAHLAKYIRDKVQLRSTADANGFYFDMNAIACDVFGKEYYPNNLFLIKRGLQQYDLNFSTAGTTKFITKTMETAKTRNMFIYKLLTDDVYQIVDIKFIDYRHYRSKNYAELIVPLLQKVCGILYENESKQPLERAIRMKYTHEESYTYKNERIVYPPMKLPDLFELIFQPKQRQHDDYRWSLLQWLFGFEDDFLRSIMRMDRKYFAVLVTLKYLLQQGEIVIAEADAFLATEYYVCASKVPKMTTELPIKLNTHFIRIAHLYTKIFCFVSHCIEVCGLSELTKYLMFDGQYFHKTLEDFTLSAEKVFDVVQSIMPYRIYAN